MEGMELTLEADEPDSMAHTPWLGLRPAGSPEASFSARARLGLPRASAGLGQSAARAAVMLARHIPCLVSSQARQHGADHGAARVPLRLRRLPRTAHEPVRKAGGRSRSRTPPPPTRSPSLSLGLKPKPGPGPGPDPGPDPYPEPSPSNYRAASRRSLSTRRRGYSLRSTSSPSRASRASTCLASRRRASPSRRVCSCRRTSRRCHSKYGL